MEKSCEEIASLGQKIRYLYMKEIKAVEFTMESFKDYGQLTSKEEINTDRLKQ